MIDISPLGRLPLRSPLVGRVAELTFLRDQLTAVLGAGAGRLIFVGGEPGVGKTRLVHELAADARGRGAAFLEGRYLRDGTAAYGPWVEALRGGLRALDPPDLASIVGPYGQELAQVFPDLATRLGSAPPAPHVPPDEQRRRLYDGIAELVLALARRTALVLHLDDLQWAPGIGLLAHLARRLGEAPVLLIGTYRDHEFQEQPVLLQEWADLNRARLSIQFFLKPLSEEETGELIGHYFGPAPAAQLRAPLYRKTRGNAFFVEEVLRSQAETGAVRPVADSAWEVVDPAGVSIPASMKLTIAERVGRLGEAARDLLAQAAVLGQEFEFAALLAMSGRTEDEVVAAIDRAIAARLLRDRSRPGEERYAFWDDQVQEVLYEGLTAPRRYRLHRRAGQAIEVLAAGRSEPPLEELARHFGLGNDPEKAALYAERAAEKNARLHNWFRAGPLYGQAATALAHLPDTVEVRRRRVDALLKQVSVSFVADNPEHNIARLTEARVLAESLVSGADPARAAIASPIGAEPADDDRLLLAEVELWIGRLLIYRLRYQEALEYFRRVRAITEAAGRGDLRAVSVSLIGRVLVELGRFDEAAPLLAEAAAELEAVGNWSEWMWNTIFAGLSLAARGYYAAGVGEARRAFDRAVETNNRNLAGASQFLLSLIHLQGGDYEAMLESGQATVQAGESSGNRLYIRGGLGFQAWAASRLGDHHQADEKLRAFQALDRSLGGHLVFGDWFASMAAEIALNGGGPAEALSLAQTAADLAHSIGGIFAEGLAHRVWALALQAVQSPESIVQSAGVLSPNTLVSTGPWTNSSPEAQFAASVRLLETGAAVLEAARTHVAWGLFCRDQGEVGAAIDHLEQAIVPLDAAGVTRELTAARDALRALEQTTRASGGRRSGGAHPAGLSDREIQVLRLIAAGRTTKEIAAELFVSVATVERHITHLYTKIGARSRVDATAFALGHGLAYGERRET